MLARKKMAANFIEKQDFGKPKNSKDENLKNKKVKGFIWKLGF